MFTFTKSPKVNIIYVRYLLFISLNETVHCSYPGEG